jgi:ketosteroid isomerase-like protein
MKIFVLLLFIFSSLRVTSQNNLVSLIRAEKDFAAYSVSHNTKAAFLKYLDSTGVVFENGNPVNGIEAWNKKEVRQGILNWHPQFAEISASGNLGYTTGPWTFQPKTITDSIVARGQYATVWHLDKEGNWKFLVDLGINETPIADIKEVEEINVNLKTYFPIDLSSLLKAEKAFIRQFNKDKIKAYKQCLSKKTVLNRNRHLPATRAEELANSISETPAEIKFQVDHSGISNSGDLGFVYGTSLYKDKKENYLRVWRRENHDWKIAMDVVRY